MLIFYLVIKCFLISITIHGAFFIECLFFIRLKPSVINRCLLHQQHLHILNPVCSFKKSSLAFLHLPFQPEKLFKSSWIKRWRNKTEPLGPIIVFCFDISKQQIRDFPGGPVVKNSPSKARGKGLIPHQGAGIPHASWPKSQSIKQKQYCSNKDFKSDPHQKKKKKTLLKNEQQIIHKPCQLSVKDVQIWTRTTLKFPVYLSSLTGSYQHEQNIPLVNSISSTQQELV